MLKYDLLTGPDAVHNAEEGIAVAPALAKVPDLDAELVRNLRPAPLKQRLLGAHLPLFLDGGAAGLVAPTRAQRSGHRRGPVPSNRLAKLLQDARVLLNL